MALGEERGFEKKKFLGRGITIANSVIESLGSVTGQKG